MRNQSVICEVNNDGGCLRSAKGPFPFILRELLWLRPIVKQIFGFTHVYLDEKLLCSLRDSPKQPATNGMWLYTTVEHLESLGREFPQLPKRYLWRSGRNGWVILASKLENFEEHALRACELIMNGDHRVGRLSRRQVRPRR